MGNITNSSKKELKLHVIVYEWLGSKTINLKAPEEKFHQKDYLITQNGNLQIDNKKKVYEWVKQRSSGRQNVQKTIINFNMNQFNARKKKLQSDLCNISKNKDQNQQLVWQLINFMKKNQQQIGIKVEEGQSFKLGSQIMKLKAMVSMSMVKKSSKKRIQENSIDTENQYYSLKNLSELDSIKDLPEIIEKDMTCRICLEKETKINRFHNFCGCKKTMPTHLNCLQLWLKKNSQFNESNDIECDICKTQFPSTYISKEGIEKPLIQPDIPSNVPYALLEIYKIQDPTIIKALMLVELKQDQYLTLGRSEDSDIRFKHNSISREHCSFKINKKGFYLIDRDSKFGTFVEMNSKQIKKRQEVMLQIDKYLIEIHPFRNTPCQCIELRDYQKIETNPFKEIRSKKNFKKSKSKKKVLTTIDNKIVDNSRFQCSLEEIQEDPREKLLKSHQVKEIDLFKSKQSEINQENNLNDSEMRMAEILENKSFRESLGFRSILLRNTVNNRNSIPQDMIMETRNDLYGDDDQLIFQDSDIHEPLSEQYRFNQQFKQFMINDNSINKNSNVQVFLRLKPPNEDQTFIDQLGKDRKTIQVQKDFEMRNFQFDKIFLPREPQFTVFINSCSHVLKGVVRGYNGCIFAYGQTGSGKTFTILGEPKLNIQGILQYSIAYLLSLKKEINLEISCIQVYMENLYDLFSQKEKKININYTNNKGATPKNLISYRIENMQDLEQIIEIIFKNRKTKKTYMNQRSSRSHAIFRIQVQNQEYQQYNYLNIIDLAGSERIKKSKIIKIQQRNETISINTSLMALGKCIKHLSSNNIDISLNLSQALSDNSIDNFSIQTSSKSITKKKHIPYRDSKLTMILQNSLCGKSLLSLIVTISPDIHNVGESFSSLRFASGVMKLEIQPIQNKIQKKKEKKQEEILPSFIEEKQDIEYQTNFTFKEQQQDSIKEQSTQIISNYSQSNRYINKNMEDYSIEELLSENQILKKQNEIFKKQIDNQQFIQDEQNTQQQNCYIINKDDSKILCNKINEYIIKGSKNNVYKNILENNFKISKEILDKQKQQIQNLQYRQNILDKIYNIQILQQYKQIDKIRLYFKIKKIYNFLIKKIKYKNQMTHFKQIKIAMGKEMLLKIMKINERIFNNMNIRLNKYQLNLFIF